MSLNTGITVTYTHITFPTFMVRLVLFLERALYKANHGKHWISKVWSIQPQTRSPKPFNGMFSIKPKIPQGKVEIT